MDTKDGKDQDRLDAISDQIDWGLPLKPGDVEFLRDYAQALRSAAANAEPENGETQQVTEAMRHIRTLDPGASIRQNTNVGFWYVSVSIDIARDGMLTGVSLASAAETPNKAVLTMLDALQTVSADTRAAIVTGANSPERKHWRWDGTSFREIPWKQS